MGYADTDDLKKQLHEAAARDPLEAYRAAGYTHEPKRDGKNWAGLCQLHDEATASFTIYADGGWWCYGCSQPGDGADLIAWYRRANPVSFPEAVEQLADRLGLRPQAKPTGHEKQVVKRTRYLVRDLGGEVLAVHTRVDYADGSKDCPWPKGTKRDSLPLYGTERLRELEPGAVVVIVEASSLFPVSGLFTVTVPVTVTIAPTGIFPVHVTPELLTVSVPEVAVWSPFGVASSNTSAALVKIVIPV